MRQLLELVLLQLLLALPGAWLGQPWLMLGGAVLGALVALGLERERAEKLARWMHTGASDRAPRLPLLWTQLAEQVRKLMRREGRKLQASEARLQQFLFAIESSPYGVVLLDRGDSIEWCNLNASQWLGIDPQRDRRQKVANLVRAPEFVQFLQRHEAGGEVTIDGRDATAARPQRVSVHLHEYGNDRKLLLLRDVTERDRADTMRRDFVANVSHEIRTPLTVFSGLVETLRDLPLNEQERQHYLERMLQQTRRLQSLVDDLLTLSRLEAGPLAAVSEWTSTHDLMDTVVAEARALAATQGRGAQRLVAHAGKPMEVACAPGEMLSAMSNLLSNAVRYTPDGGLIDASWLSEGDALVFEVRDTGPGIAEEHLPRITERFYRVDRSRSRETGGTGLGLAIVKHVAQRHGAQLQVASVPGKGSTFRLVLPAVRLRPQTPAPTVP